MGGEEEDEFRSRLAMIGSPIGAAIKQTTVKSLYGYKTVVVTLICFWGIP